MPVDRIRWGILGCGKIAEKFAQDLALSKTGKLIACASRNAATAEQFAQRYHAEKWYNNYTELTSDPQVDVVYIATPHSLHHSHTMLCLDHNKHVLVEKPAAVNVTQFRQMSLLASSKKLLLMEAMWTAFLPAVAEVRNTIIEGRIGELRHINADFGFISPFDAESRLFNPMLAGGSLLDIGIYPVFISLFLLGKPTDIKSSATLTDTAVDDECTVLLTFGQGATASLYSSLRVHTETKCEIYGTKGKISIPGRFHEQDHFFVTDERGHTVRTDCGRTGRGYWHETEHVNSLLLEGRAESPVMSHDMSLLLLEVMDEVRKQNGIIYPFET